eukprot:365945-Chlamydomonas_euryale.AAC.12
MKEQRWDQEADFMCSHLNQLDPHAVQQAMLHCHKQPCNTASSKHSPAATLSTPQGNVTLPPPVPAAAPDATTRSERSLPAASIAQTPQSSAGSRPAAGSAGRCPATHGTSEKGNARPNAANTVPANCTAGPATFGGVVAKELSNTTASGSPDSAVEVSFRPPAPLGKGDCNCTLAKQSKASHEAAWSLCLLVNIGLTTPEAAANCVLRPRTTRVPDSANQAGKCSFRDGGVLGMRGVERGVELPASDSTPSVSASSHSTGTHAGGVPQTVSPGAHGLASVIARSTVTARTVPECACTTVNHARKTVPTAALVLMPQWRSPADASRRRHVASSGRRGHCARFARILWTGIFSARAQLIRSALHSAQSGRSERAQAGGRQSTLAIIGACVTIEPRCQPEGTF